MMDRHKNKEFTPEVGPMLGRAPSPNLLSNPQDFTASTWQSIDLTDMSDEEVERHLQIPVGMNSKRPSDKSGKP